MPKLCENCGMYDPTPKLTAESRCPCCGVVYAKLTRRASSAESDPATGPVGVASFAVDEIESGRHWLPIGRAERWLSVAGVCALFLVLFLDADGLVLLLDHANLAFHEAGHLVFGLLGGGEHDWYLIFSRWGLLDHDTEIAFLMRTVGWFGMLGCLLWLWRRSDLRRHAGGSH